jgi:xanthosine utilization system XapX-like protein
MDIDLSKIVLIVLAVLPGFVALRSYRNVAPRPLHRRGATEELAEFFLYSVFAHGFLIAVLYFLAYTPAVDEWLRLSPGPFVARIGAIPTLYLFLYFVLSLVAGWVVGIGRGLLAVWRPAAWIVKRSGVLGTPIHRFWYRFVGRHLLRDQPIIYDILSPETDETGRPKLVFVEVELKDSKGIYTGLVKAFSIIQDEESHKLVCLEQVYHKASAEAEYTRLAVDSMLLDLADTIALRVRQVAEDRSGHSVDHQEDHLN